MPSVGHRDPALVVTADEIARSGAATAWEAIRFTIKRINLKHTRNGAPRRIVRRGQPSIVLRDERRVFVDDLRVGDVGVLQQIAASDIALIRVLIGLDAPPDMGPTRADGVTLIDTRAGPKLAKSVELRWDEPHVR